MPEASTIIALPAGAALVEACITHGGNTYRFAPMCDGTWVCFEYDLGARPGNPKARIDANSLAEMLSGIERRATSHAAVCGPTNVDADGAPIGGSAPSEPGRKDGRHA